MQVYVLLRDIASENHSQVVLVTHSEVILDESLDKNLTLLLEGQADDVAAKKDIRNTLKHYGAAHYVKARERGYVLYVEGGTDLDMLRALAVRLKHPVAAIWDERLNSVYVQNNYPSPTLDSELERVEGGFGITPRQHFNGLRDLIPGLKGLAILDNDGQNRQPSQEVMLRTVYWRRYEAENYFITPEVLRRFAIDSYKGLRLFQELFQKEIDEVLRELILEHVFGGSDADYKVFFNSSPDASRLLWDAKTERLKLSDFAEEFFRQLANKLGHAMLLSKGELHRLVPFTDAAAIPAEVFEKLNHLDDLFRSARDFETSYASDEKTLVNGAI